jgi:proton-dependent oligopeptide transporter, POT family
MLGAYMADTFWGRYLTIQISIGIAILGHVFIIIAAIPQLIDHPNAAVGVFAVGIVIFGVGAGGFKSNISPLIAEQYEASQPKQVIKVLKSGERVILDPQMTFARIYM